MQKHLVNLRRFQSQLGDLAKLVGGNKHFYASVGINTHSHIPADHPDNGFKYQCYIADVGVTNDCTSMKEALVQMKQKVKAKLAEGKAEPAAMPVESNDDDLF